MGHRVVCGCLLLLVWVVLPGRTGAQEVGDWHITVGGIHSQPVGGLSKWFRGASNAELSVGQKCSQKWTISGSLELARYEREALTGYAAGRVDLLLEHVAVLASGEVEIAEWGPVHPSLLLSGGLYRWKGVRGAIQADSTVRPYVPAIAARTLQTTNWGLRVGAGASVHVWRHLEGEASLCYRLVLGDLWPTMQPHIELEGVSGLQTINISVGMRIWF